MFVTPIHPDEIAKRFPFFQSFVAAGFPSPADDYVEKSLSLDELLIKHPAATYFVQASGSSMIGSGIFDKDILIVDRAREVTNGSIVIACIDGELTCKYIDTHNRCLISANPNYPAIYINEEENITTEGVVAFSIRCHKPCTL
ncbi:translesion error-prone DNA polymerase V autoproteolytic subunit [Litoribacillus peritrichatus]|uniref:Translesion error-prone DNA polymerase V autoproteolytic subunit n=1 Tax=Litoribacillus peritrichatus TaxID=718191 RepID=A0ABP7MV89_9GAMM